MNADKSQICVHPRSSAANSSDHHDHLALAAAVELTQKDSLPATEQQFSILETESVTEDPVRLALMCASEFSSPWRKPMPCCGINVRRA